MADPFNNEDEFKRLVLGALNQLLGLSLNPSEGKLDAYYEDWLRRMRELLDAQPKE